MASMSLATSKNDSMMEIYYILISKAKFERNYIGAETVSAFVSKIIDPLIINCMIYTEDNSS